MMDGRRFHSREVRQLDASEVKAQVAPTDFFRHELPGMPDPRNRTGWVSGGLCPYHKDQRVGNFRVHLTTGAFFCFACGAKGGDMIAFIQMRHGLLFPEALRVLAEDWGVWP